MEPQEEVVDAAEALRAWVRQQRTSWTPPQTDKAGNATDAERIATPVPASPSAPPQSPAPPAAQPACVPPVVTRPSIDLNAPEVDASDLAPVYRDQSHDIVSKGESGVPLISGRTIRLAAAAVVVLGLAAGAVVGGRSMWQRYQATPRIGTASIVSTPPGAQVMVDGKPLGTTPVSLELNAGRHAVELRLKNAVRTEQIDVVKGQQTSINVEWNPKRVGTLHVDSTPPKARVLVDGRERGTTPLALDDLTVGAHIVQIESDEGSVKRRVQIAENRPQKLTESLFPGWLVVTSPIEVTIFDGRQPLQLDTGNRVFLKPGLHDLHIENRALNFQQNRQIEIEPGGTIVLDIELPPSTLTVTGATGADVFVDGVKAGAIPLTDYKVKLGTRDVMVVDKSGATRHATVTVTSAPVQLDINFAKP